MSDIDTLAINCIRVLAADTVRKADSGHPGAPLGMAPAAHVLFSNMKFNPQDPEWTNRDRFVLSNGHAVALQYVMLHFLGYDLTLDDLKSFRQLGSKTPGHPERETPGVEVTTGPLGQGISNAVGLAIAQANIAATYNKPDFTISDNYTYSFFGDGCMMEGVSHEACSLAGHLKLGNLIAFYDDNKISIDGNTALEFDEDVAKRLQAYGWEVIDVPNADTDVAAISSALQKAKQTKDKPTCIQIHTTIGYGSVNAGTASVHGSPLKPEDIAQLKKKFGFDPKKFFAVPQQVYDYYHKVSAAGAKAEKEWKSLFASYKKAYPKEAAEYERRQSGKLPEGWEKLLPSYTPADPATATRKLSETVLSDLVAGIPEIIGGSADLTPSNLTRWKNAVDFQPPQSGLGEYSGRYIRYGVREFGMGAIMNGISAYGMNLKAYGGTFLNFVSYAAGAVRLSALSGLPVIWVATHDSIGLGEDGPTHQPIETLAHFRALPNLMVWRPADGNEVSAAYKVSLESDRTPSIIALTRQGLPELKGSSVEKASKGGYVLQDPSSTAKLIIVATGSEVSLSVKAAELLEKRGIPTRVVSLPDFFSFDHQSLEYKKSVLPDGVPIMSVEVLTTFGWSKYSHSHFGLDRFGASGKANDIFNKFEFTPEGVAKRGAATVGFFKGSKLLSPLDQPFTSIQ
ncbi:Transketolase [Brettanomyces nanus]|uniref:Transketolase n=1 Tax=Eeniella nana TaxID=13502 RepID=A0A875S0B5_EENNA|nr:Transketolase [Brettanomyces nanus]QPG73562.1 Transketolase [Brettanomyces nanus]